MANVKITDLAAYTDPASTDVLPIVDVGADVTKKVSIADLLENAGSGTESLPGIAFDGDPNTGIYSPGADQVAISTGGTGRLFVDASGNVGIDVATPVAPLDINLAADRGIQVIASTSNPSFIRSYQGSVSNNIRDVGLQGNNIIFETGPNTGSATTEAARIDDSGRLLVNTSSAPSTTAGRLLQVVQNDGGATFVLARNDASVSEGSNLGRVEFFGNVGGTYEQGAFIDAVADGTHALGDKPTRLVFSTNPGSPATGPTERMRIDSTGSISFNGATKAAGSYKIAIGGSLEAEASTRAYWSYSAITSSTTTSATYYQAQVLTEAASFTCTDVVGFLAGANALGAGSAITNAYAFNAQNTWIRATNNYGFYSDIGDSANRWNFYANGTAPNYFAGKIASLGSYNDTTASAANVFIASNGDIQRSTSSIRYKTDVETLEQSYADNVILNARPVWYRSLCEADNAGWSYYGLIAEEIAELDPRLVFWGHPTKEVLQEEAKDAVLDDEGNVIEPATEAVYTNVEDTNAELRPEGVQYDRLTVMLIDVVQRQQKAIEALEAKVAALEAS